MTDQEILSIAVQHGDEHDESFIFNKCGRWSVLSFARAVLDQEAKATTCPDCNGTGTFSQPGELGYPCERCDATGHSGSEA